MKPDDIEHGRSVSRYVQLELHELDDLALVGFAPAGEHLRGPAGNVRAGALLTLLDNVGGLCGGLAALPDGWVVSTNLAARMVARSHSGPLRLGAQVLRRGRNNVVTAVQIHDDGADGALVADGVLTSAILVPENGPPQWERPMHMHSGPPLDAPPPIDRWLGVRALDSQTVEIDLADELRNPWGILHGGVVAMLVDLATEHATSGGTTTDVVLHFLAPSRVGPVRVRAEPIGTRSDGATCRVEVRDAGADRVTALAIATARE